MLKKIVEPENQINVFVSDMVKVMSKCNCINKIIIDLTAENFLALR